VAVSVQKLSKKRKDNRRRWLTFKRVVLAKIVSVFKNGRENAFPLYFSLKNAVSCNCNQN